MSRSPAARHASAHALALLATLVTASVELRAEPTDTIARGRYLTEVANCSACHTPGHLLGTPSSARLMGGSEVGFDLPGTGVVYGPNLTPDRDTGLGRWTVEQIATVLHGGPRPDGRTMVAGALWSGHTRFEPADARAIAAYLATLPPICNQVPASAGPGETPRSYVLRVVAPTRAAVGDRSPRSDAGFAERRAWPP